MKIRKVTTTRVSLMHSIMFCQTKLLSQCISLYSLQKHGIEYSFEGHNVQLLDSNSAITVFRGILETYLTWNHIYSYSNDETQNKAKFILWKLESIKSLNQIKNNPNKVELFKNLNETLNDDIDSLEKELFKNEFFNSLSCINKGKLRKLDKKRPLKVNNYNWKFLYSEKTKALKLHTFILPYIKDEFGDFYHDLYKFTSMYVHSSYTSANQLYRNDVDNYSALKVINSFNQHSFQILCLGIRDLVNQNLDLSELFEAKLKKNEAFKIRYFSTLNWFIDKKK